MKVLLVQPYAHLRGHYYPFAHSLSSTLQESGTETTLLVWHGPSSSTSARDPNYSMLSASTYRRPWIPKKMRILMKSGGTGVARLLLTFFTIRTARRVFIEEQYDAIHILDAEYSALVLFRWSRKKYGTPIVNVIESDFNKHKKSLASRVRWMANELSFKYLLLTRKAFMGVTHAEEVTQALEEKGYVTKGQLATIPLPVERCSSQITQEDARATLGIKDKQMVLLFFGVLRENKGLYTLVKSLAGLSEDYRCMIVGADPNGISRTLLKMILELGLSDRVDLRIGYISENDMPLYFYACDGVLLPYSKDFNQASGVLALALGFQRPVVVTDTGQMGKIVKEWELGEVAPTESPTDLENAIRTFIRWDQTKREMVQTNLEDFADHFSWETTAEKHRALYHNSRC